MGWVSYGSSRLILVGLGNLQFLQVKKHVFLLVLFHLLRCDVVLFIIVVSIADPAIPSTAHPFEAQPLPTQGTLCHPSAAATITALPLTKGGGENFMVALSLSSQCCLVHLCAVPLLLPSPPSHTAAAVNAGKPLPSQRSRCYHSAVADKEGGCKFYGDGRGGEGQGTRQHDATQRDNQQMGRREERRRRRLRGGGRPPGNTTIN